MVRALPGGSRGGHRKARAGAEDRVDWRRSFVVGSEGPLSEFLRTLESVFREPLAIEAFFALVVLVILFFAVRTLKGVAARISRRKALRDFVGGVDLFFKGEYESARDTLSRVIERDPENSEARILLGDACRESGDLAEAHKHHYQVAKVFGQDLPRNRLSLGRDLLEMGRAGEAVEHLKRAADADPDDPAVLRLLLTASLDAGRLPEAVALARRLEEESTGEGRERARRERATVAVLAGREYVRRGETRDGVHLLKSAVRLNPALVAPRLELVRAAWLFGSRRAAEKELLGQLKEMSRLAGHGEIVFEPPGPGAGLGGSDGAPSTEPGGEQGESTRSELPEPALGALPAPAGEETPAGRESEATAVVRSPGPDGGGSIVGPDEIPGAPALASAGEFAKRLLPREAVYLCAECGRGEVQFSEACRSCGSFGSLVPADDAALAPVPEIREILDEIAENRSFLRKLAGRAAKGDEGAADRLVEAGPRAVGGIFREILRAPDAAPLVRILTRMGPDAVPAILRNHRRASSFSTKRLMREGVRAFRSLIGVVVKALAGMGEAVLPDLEELLETGDRGLRQVAIDVLIRLGRAERLEEVRLTVPVKEILDRLNACPEEELDPLLDACDPEGLLAKRILTDRTYASERALVRAMARPGNRRKMREILIRRGFSAVTFDALEEIWGEEELRILIRDVVRSYGRAAADHLVKVYTSPHAPDSVKEDALGLFLDLGDEEIERLVERLAEGDPETEKAVLRGVRAFGSRAVPELVRAYGKSGLLQKMGLNRRRLLYRKVTLLRALGQIGTYDAMQGLKQIRDREGDPELRRRVQGILTRLSGRGEGA